MYVSESVQSVHSHRKCYKSRINIDVSSAPIPKKIGSALVQSVQQPESDVGDVDSSPRSHEVSLPVVFLQRRAAIGLASLPQQPWRRRFCLLRFLRIFRHRRIEIFPQIQPVILAAFEQDSCEQPTLSLFACFSLRRRCVQKLRDGFGRWNSSKVFQKRVRKNSICCHFGAK